jgi:hypothetical protein
MARLVAIYQIALYDPSGTLLAILDDYRSLQFQKVVNDKGFFTLIINNSDSKRDLFERNGILVVMRKIPGYTDWYTEFTGHCEDFYTNIYQNGNEQFIVVGSGLNGLLARRIIAYEEGTFQASKSDPAETVMKEFVEENIGPSATVANTRFAEGAMANFTVSADLGTGAVWDGDRTGKNLLQVLQEIANFSEIDFAVNTDVTVGNYIFETYEDQLGSDRTIVGLNPATGLNAAGNAPHVFSPLMGNVQQASFSTKSKESSNRVFVYGQGTGAGRQIEYREDATLFDPADNINLRESMRGGSSQDSVAKLQSLGDEQLEKLREQEKFEFDPLDIPSSLYGVHYFFGDKVTVKVSDEQRNKRIVSVKISLASGKGESQKSFEFEDIPS